MSAGAANLVTGLVSFLLTVLVFSYLLGDNPLFRVVIYIFVGVSAGYIASVAWWQVLWPDLFEPLLTGDSPGRFLLAIPLLLGVLLLMRLSPRLSRLGGPALGYLVGVGAAVAIGGAVLGTMLPLVQATLEPFRLQPGGDIFFNLLEGSFLLVGTVSTLVYFHFGARRAPDGTPRRPRLIEAVAWLGRIFIAITFGVLFAGVYAAALTALVERINSLITFLTSL